GALPGAVPLRGLLSGRVEQTGGCAPASEPRRQLPSRACLPLQQTIVRQDGDWREIDTAMKRLAQGQDLAVRDCVVVQIKDGGRPRRDVRGGAVFGQRVEEDYRAGRPQDGLDPLLCGKRGDDLVVDVHAV